MMKPRDNGRRMDSCPSPWDDCCDPRKTTTANSAVIKIVAKVQAQAVLINATGFFVKP